MKTVLAAVDDSPADRDVLQTALVIGDLTGAVVEAVHVRAGLRRTTGPGRRARGRVAVARRRDR